MALSRGKMLAELGKTAYQLQQGTLQGKEKEDSLSSEDESSSEDGSCAGDKDYIPLTSEDDDEDFPRPVRKERNVAVLNSEQGNGSEQNEQGEDRVDDHSDGENEQNPHENQDGYSDDETLPIGTPGSSGTRSRSDTPVDRQRKERKESGRPVKGRKRKHEDQSRSQRKRRSSYNERYINVKGVEVLPKKFNETFSCSCKKKCTDVLSVEVRRDKQFSKFWALGSYEARCVFINKCVKQNLKKRTYTKRESKRNMTRKYFFDEIEACKMTFLKTLQISQSRVDVALKKVTSDSFQDLRGVVSGGRNKITEEQLNSVINHIKSFPNYTSHYCRSVTGQGTQEVATCLRHYINQLTAPVTKHILWSDSCGGQNRSIKLMLALQHILQRHVSLQTITIRFPVSGHSFLPNDQEFGDVECKLKCQQRLYTLSDYVKIMETCRRVKKFKVQRMEGKSFLSTKPLEDMITNRKVDVAKEPVSWLQTREIILRKCEPYAIFMKRSLGTAEQKVDILKRQKGRPVQFQHVDLPMLWPNGKPLSVEKLKDLQNLLTFVPKDAKPFYSFLKSATTGNFLDDIEGFSGDLDFELDDH